MPAQGDGESDKKDGQLPGAKLDSTAQASVAKKGVLFAMTAYHDRRAQAIYRVQSQFVHKGSCMACQLMLLATGAFLHDSGVHSAWCRQLCPRILQLMCDLAPQASALRSCVQLPLQLQCNQPWDNAASCLELKSNCSHLPALLAGPGPVQPIIPDRPGTVIHVGKIFQALLLAYVIFLALFVKWLKPSFWSLTSSILLGAVLGLAYSAVQAWNKSRRDSLRNLVRACKRLSLLPLSCHQCFVTCPAYSSDTSQLSAGRGKDNSLDW